ncbi:MAG TPA: hypothetical protein VFY75_10550 [Solirubrobacterales bacterium]|nr:hypothetical protein [Solirubrobacterales bacterium]
MKRGISAFLVLASLALPAVAPAAPPANDKFASRQVLGPGFPAGKPVEAAGDNFEADKEAGESIPGLAPAGHSVWFEWEATGDGWVSVGACDSDFPTLVGVFVGTEVDELAPVAFGNGSEGPDCPNQGRQYTFKAGAGTRYVIAVDGNSYTGPEPLPVETEGLFTLRIEETPVPPNDEFEDAAELAGQIDVEPDGARRYFAHTQGYNWNAENEHGEPDELISGASVWYSWTAPESGTYRFGDPCCGGLDLDLYAGNAVDELDPVLVGQEFGEVALTAGQVLRIRVSGPIDLVSEEPRMESFSVIVSANLAPLPRQAAGTDAAPIPPPDITPPETTISKKVLAFRPWFVFKLNSNEAGSTFRCSLDRQPFKACGARKFFKHLSKGHHRLRAVAVDPVGNVDRTPAVVRFRFPVPGNREHHGIQALTG